MNAMRALPAMVLLWPALAAADGTERRLHPHQVDASSFLWNDWNKFQENYHPLYVADDDPTTAWVEGADGSGAGEWIRLRVTQMDGATRVRLKLRAGYQKSDGLFKANARPNDITVKLLPGGVEAKTALADAEGWQEVVVDQPPGKLDAVQIRIDSVYEGTKYKDLCLSDVQIYATATTRDNPAFEKGKLDKTLAWKADRLAAAKMFHKEAVGALAVLPSYTYRYRDAAEVVDWAAKCDGGEATCPTRLAVGYAHADAAFVKRWGAELAVADAALGDRAGFVQAQVVPVDKRRVPEIDGLRSPKLSEAVDWSWGIGGMELPLLGTLGALRADQLGMFDVKDKVAFDDVRKSRAPGCRSKAGATYTWVRKGKSADGKDVIRGLLLFRCGRVEVREGHEDVSQLQVAVYDDAGRLSLVAGLGYANGFEWSQDRKTLIAGRAFFADGSGATVTAPAVVTAK